MASEYFVLSFLSKYQRSAFSVILPNQKNLCYKKPKSLLVISFDTKFKPFSINAFLHNVQKCISISVATIPIQWVMYSHSCTGKIRLDRYESQFLLNGPCIVVTVVMVFQNVQMSHNNYRGYKSRYLLSGSCSCCDNV